MHDTVIDIVSALLALVAVATFATMIWAARQVDGRTHATPRLHLPHPHLPHPRRRA
ncbi:MAG TPA: hypothetical protein VGO48_02835 [Conexibacter sp.]|jgi:hypothetical protein|nr:hypothetical protein [Conexibacter sp.]